MMFAFIMMLIPFLCLLLSCRNGERMLTGGDFLRAPVGECDRGDGSPGNGGVEFAALAFDAHMDTGFS